MFSVLSVMLMIGLSSTPAVGQVVPINKCGPDVLSNVPKCIAQTVYNGKDSDMTEGALYQISINPARDSSGAIEVPSRIGDAFRLMRAMLPHWYLNALFQSHGDYRCDVMVNGTSYGTLVGAWVRSNWHLDLAMSPLRRQFVRLGFHHPDSIDQALTYGFCTYIKDGEAKAMQVIRKRAAWEKAHPLGPQSDDDAN